MAEKITNWDMQPYRETKQLIKECQQFSQNSPGNDFLAHKQPKRRHGRRNYTVSVTNKKANATAINNECSSTKKENHSTPTADQPCYSPIENVLKLSAELLFHKGNVLHPLGPGRKIIAHICNTAGAWGGGFTKALSRRWLEPGGAYRRLRTRQLGAVAFIEVEPNIEVANMIAQVFHSREGPPIRYWALSKALQLVASRALECSATVHMPRIGCGLAGGNWDKVEPIIRDQLLNAGIQVHVYDL